MAEVTIHWTRFDEGAAAAPRKLMSLAPIDDGPGYLMHTWVLRDDRTYDQLRPEMRPTMASAISLVPPGSRFYPVPPDFALMAWEVP